MDSKDGVYFGGIPTDVDVRKIEDSVGIPESGTLVPYNLLEEIIGHNRSENRWHSVVSAWRRKLLREHNLVTEAERGEGLVVLTNERRVDHVGRRTSHAVRAIRRNIAIAAKTPRDGLSPEKVRRLDHEINMNGAVLNVVAAKSKEYISGVPTPPRIHTGTTAPDSKE